MIILVTINAFFQPKTFFFLFIFYEYFSEEMWGTVLWQGVGLRNSSFQTPFVYSLKLSDGPPRVVTLWLGCDVIGCVASASLAAVGGFRINVQTCSSVHTASLFVP